MRDTYLDMGRLLSMVMSVHPHGAVVKTTSCVMSPMVQVTTPPAAMSTTAGSNRRLGAWTAAARGGTRTGTVAVPDRVISPALIVAVITAVRG